MAPEATIRPQSRGRAAPKSQPRVKVLLVEDIPTIAAAMQAALLSAGFDVQHALTGADALARKDSFHPDIALVDLELPDFNGIELVERFAADGDCGVIVVTANDEAAARVAGLETGADDYVVKPIPAPELVARIHAVHRRLNKPASSRQLRIFVDTAQRCLITGDSKRILLTEAEMSALEAMLEATGNSVSRDWLSRVALKRPLHADDRAVDQLVMKLRRKLTEAGASERVILSARRQGYTIADPSIFRIVTPTAPLPPK